MRKKILVTGGGGYIGSVLVNTLLQSNYAVTVLDNFAKGNFLPKNTDLQLIKGSILDTKILKSSVFDNKTVIHLAGISDGRAGKKNPELTKKTNLEAFKSIIDIAANSGVTKFLNMSTFGVYGNDYNCELTENLKVNPQEPYSETKAQTEIIANQYNTAGFSTINIRLAMVFGWSPQMRYDFLVNTLIKLALENKELTIAGGKQKRPQIHILDVAKYLIKIIEQDATITGGETFNLGTINPSVSKIAQEIQKCVPFNLKINYLPEKENENSFELNADKFFKIIKKEEAKNITYTYHQINKKYGMD